MLIKKLRNLVILISALQVLNMSIDSPLQARDSHEDFNYIDSYIEYVAEVMLKFENAIPETKNRQHKDTIFHKHTEVICQVAKIQNTIKAITSVPSKIYAGYLDNYASSFIKEINPPPPKV